MSPIQHQVPIWKDPSVCCVENGVEGQELMQGVKVGETLSVRPICTTSAQKPPYDEEMAATGTHEQPT